MREVLSDLLVEHAKSDERFIVLSGDHGYALFDALRRESPDRFVNVGVCEQGMVGYAAGMAAMGLRPVIYGLSAFVPLRVLEQVKLDLCFPSLPVVMLGDGAGVVYSSLGSSHQCAEDIACLKPLPNLRIYSPCDQHELRLCFEDACRHQGPSYIRIGKSDRPEAHRGPEEADLRPHWVQRSPGARACLVATGSMVSPCQAVAREAGVDVLSVPLIKPLDAEIAAWVAGYGLVFTVEEHSAEGGLGTSVRERLVDLRPQPFPRVVTLALAEKFADKCGSYQYALSEHGMADDQIRRRVLDALAGR